MWVLLLSCVMLGADDRRAFVDADGDGVAELQDCDDQDPERYPGAAEQCDGVDQDCDGVVDEGLLPDRDGDGYGDDSQAGASCFVDWIPQGGDCDDTNASVHPDHEELCDGIDNGCLDDWEPVDELGRVTWTDPDGVHHDLSEEWSGGSDGAPVLPLVPTAGVVTICRAAADDWHVRLVSSRIEALELRGQPLSLPDDVDEHAALPVINANTSGGDGGPALDLGGDGFTLRISEVAVIGGTTSATRSGGGLRVAEAEQLTLSGVRIVGNVAMGSVTGGGGIALEAVDSAVLTGCEISSNVAKDDTQGAGLLVVDSTVLVQDSSLDGNHARFHGGAIHLVGSSLELRQSALYDNEADDGGGALFVDAESSAALTEVVVEGSVGAQGGALWVEGVLQAAGITLRGNHSDYHGAVAAIFGAGALELSESSVEENTVGKLDPFALEALEGPELYLAEDSWVTTRGRYFAITGSEVNCTVAEGCGGAVDEAPELY